MKKEKKIGVSFKITNSKTYCHVNYDKKSTRFVYSNYIKSDKKEIETIRRVIRFLINYESNFTLKNVGVKIQKLTTPFTDYWEVGVLNELGNHLTFNQFNLLYKSNNRECCDYHELLDFLELSTISKIDLKKFGIKKNEILYKISPSKILEFRAYIFAFVYSSNEWRLIDWILNKSEINKVIEEYTIKEILNMPNDIGIPLPKSPAISKSELYDILIEKLNDVERNLLNNI